PRAAEWSPEYGLARPRSIRAAVTQLSSLAERSCSMRLARVPRFHGTGARARDASNMSVQPESSAESPPPGCCAVEPIHIPDSIQPHGALLAFTLNGVLSAWSENVSSLLPRMPVSGNSFRDVALDAEVTHAISECITDDLDSSPSTAETQFDGQPFVVVVH